MILRPQLPLRVGSSKRRIHNRSTIFKQEDIDETCAASNSTQCGGIAICAPVTNRFVVSIVSLFVT